MTARFAFCPSLTTGEYNRLPYRVLNHAPKSEFILELLESFRKIPDERGKSRNEV